ncbi:glycine--tRNA ligase [Candidatus Woesearchaeota archaeon]|nr:glycine--tRNA ligase [Candidatus Woesearchaeota archaeon]
MRNIEELSRFCKEKGFIFPNSEIYGGFAGFFDFGPLGADLKKNIKDNWWKTFVQDRQDILGIDGTLITHPKVWQASGHVENFADIVLTCAKCKYKTRADHFLEDQLKEHFDGMKARRINELIESHKLVCPMCKGSWEPATDFNLMFQTNVGPAVSKSSTAYLRPETAQLMFTNFKLVFDTSRCKLPFGIAQMGKAFRNEISPRDFLFRSREFDLMEIEFFTHPDKANECPYFDGIKKRSILTLTEQDQHENQEPKERTFAEIATLTTRWHVYWISECLQWFLDLGIRKENLRLRQHKKDELAHYAGACFDIEYKFPFGWKEIHGNADRRQYDLNQHIKISGKDLSIFDEESKQKVVPYVASEPAQGVDRAFLAFLLDAYNDDKERGNIVLKLHPRLSPIKVGVFPLVNKLEDKAKEVYELLRKTFPTQYDRSGSVGRRYARADELGTPYCVTIDFESLDDQCVTVRDRDTTGQVRVAIKDLKSTLQALLRQEVQQGVPPQRFK